MRTGRRPRHGGEAGSKHQRPRKLRRSRPRLSDLSDDDPPAGATGTGGARRLSRRAVVGTARSRDRELTLRRYLIPAIIAACFAWIAIVQVVMDPHWSGGYPVVVVLAGCAGFNCWWTLAVSGFEF